MTKTVLPVAFFFGANNYSGYCSLYDNICGSYNQGKHLILKGGPGTGKSTLMKKVAERLEKRGYYIERGYCSADPQSLDMVYAPEINFSISDGTSPHIIDPVLPGVSQHIVDLGVAWDRTYLKRHYKEISELTLSNKAQHKKVAEFLKVAACFETQSVIMCEPFVDKDKVNRYITRLQKKIIPSGITGTAPKEHKRFLSAVTPDGVVVQYDSIVALSEKIITIEDEYSLVAPYIMKSISDYAVSMGYDVYKCFCPLFPDFKVEHIIIPQLKTAVFTENSYHLSIDETGKTIHAGRFVDKEGVKGVKEKLQFQKKAKKELIDEAVKKLSVALDLHDRLEEYYIKATDFEVINDIGEKIIKSL